MEGTRRITCKNDWTTPWIWGIFPYHHYHTTAWELLVCIDGQADIQFGGSDENISKTVRVEQGGINLIPPGVAHKQRSTFGTNFLLLGSYPTQSPNADTVRGGNGKPPTQQQKKNILECYIPDSEPITGALLSELYKPRCG